MTRRPKSANALIKAFLALVPETEASRAFIGQAAADAAPDELPELPPENLAAALADFWTFAEARKGKAPAIRLVHGQAGLDWLEIVQDDAPFLVDSIMGEIGDQGLSVRAMFHPIVSVARDKKGLRAQSGPPRRESMIQVMLETVGKDREAALLTGLKTTLADVRASVDDFPAMLDLMARAITELQAAPKSEVRD
ncbi:hypothetical protein BH10PSE5_BH10PSE5_29980 [soil metagenome]